MIEQMSSPIALAYMTSGFNVGLVMRGTGPRLSRGPGKSCEMKDTYRMEETNSTDVQTPESSVYIRMFHYSLPPVPFTHLRFAVRERTGSIAKYRGDIEDSLRRLSLSSVDSVEKEFSHLAIFINGYHFCYYSKVNPGFNTTTTCLEYPQLSNYSVA